MLVDTYNQSGEKLKQTRLPKEIFDVLLNVDLLHQVVVSQMANRRQSISHTKTRGDVRGAGRKPWRQKGTGRARAGSIRSPLWKGGGVTFGPRKERVFEKDIPKKMKKKALLMVLSAKVKKNLLVLLDKLKLDKAKTKEIGTLLKKLPCKNQTTLIVLSELDRNVILSARNISGVRTMQASELNALDVLSFKYLLMSKETVKSMENMLLKLN